MTRRRLSLIAVALFPLLCCVTADPTANRVQANAAYEAEQLACVDDAGTLEQSRACRHASDVRWGVGTYVHVPTDMFLPLDGGFRDAH